MELTRGTITDRPWAQTLGAIARRGFTGQLTLYTNDGKHFAIAFERGMAVGATSPVANDMIVRVALTNHFVFAGQVPALARRITAQPERDEIDVLVEACQLTADQEISLREKAIMQRAARTFSVESGTFILDDEITITTSPCIVDPLAIIYFGVRMNLAEQRLLDDLRWMGTYFQVAAHAQDELMRYGFGKDETPILEAVRTGTSIPELEVDHRELDPRTMQAVLFTLAACGTAIGTTPTEAVPPPARNKLAAGSQPSVQRIHSAERLVVKVNPDAVRTRTDPVLTPPPEEWKTLGTPGPRTTTPTPSRTHTPTPSRTGVLVPSRTSTPTARTVTPRTTTPEPLTPSPRASTQSGAPPSRPSTHSGATQPPRASSQSGVPQSRPSTHSGATPLPRSSSQSLPPLDLSIDIDLEEAPAAPPVDPVAEATNAFKRGEAAMKSDFLDMAIAELTQATKLQPENPDYAAMLAWARFCNAPDKAEIADQTRKTINQMVQKSDKPILPELLLGRVERMLGRDREALVHFQRVLDLRPRHADAAAEIRVIELRLATAPAKSGGLFGRKH